MRVSDLVKTNHYFRLYRKAISLQQSLERRSNYYAAQEQLQLSHQKRVQRVTDQLNQFTSRLDNNEFNSDIPSPACLQQPVKATMAYCFEGLPEPGPAQLGHFEKALTETMTLAGQQRAVQEQKFKLMCECAFRHQQGWYMVFNTLTVSNTHYKAVFHEDSKLFREYIDRVDRAVAISAYGSVRAAQGRDYHSYFAVVEEGSLYGRLHIHVLHFLKALPVAARDPNYGRQRPTYREIACFKPWWPNGTSSPKAVRYSRLDAFSISGYRWPIDPKTNAPALQTTQHHVAGYVTKYILKSYTSPKRTNYLWRLRKSQKLGLQILSSLTSTLPLPALVTLATDTATNYKLNRRKIPSQLLRLASLRQIQNLISSQKTFSTLKALEPRPSLLMLLRTSTAENAHPSLPSTILSALQLSDAAATFDAARPLITQAIKALDDRYFRTSTSPTTITSHRDLQR